MTTIPDPTPLTPEQAYVDLQKWWQQQQQLKTLKFLEHNARVRMVEFYFPTPREGTNNIDMGGGYNLTLAHTFDYNVDEAAFNSAKASDFKKLKIDRDALFVMKPALSLKAYRKLTEEQRAFVDELLDIKPNSPQLHIVPKTVEPVSENATELSEPPTVVTRRSPRAPRKGKPIPAPAKATAKKTAPPPPKPSRTPKAPPPPVKRGRGRPRKNP